MAFSVVVVCCCGVFFAAIFPNFRRQSIQDSTIYPPCTRTSIGSSCDSTTRPLLSASQSRHNLCQFRSSYCSSGTFHSDALLLLLLCRCRPVLRLQRLL